MKRDSILRERPGVIWPAYHNDGPANHPVSAEAAENPKVSGVLATHARRPEASEAWRRREPPRDMQGGQSSAPEALARVAEATFETPVAGCEALQASRYNPKPEYAAVMRR